ncbi:MAG TPA: HAMP domain-containing histidine kinase [Thiomicrorhabdus sp.]|nr:HAMP domain-containing histidine kinase [Thiomicrorhabdus sp.]
MPDFFAPELVHVLWLGLIFIGVALFFTAYYFRHESKRLSKALSDLYALNQAVKQDALDFLEQAWPILDSLGCLNMEANIQWFGEKKTLYFGRKSFVGGKGSVFHIARDDMVFSLDVRLNRKAAEPESLSFLVIKTFVSILEQNLVLKQAEILTSQKRLERYQLFVQHEMKNIAQFIQLLCEQVDTLQEDADKIRLVDRLHLSLPAMAERAQKMIRQMKRPLEQDYECTELPLQEVLQNVVNMYGLEASIVGQATVCLPSVLLTEVFKNILGNFRDHALTEQVIQISIQSDVAKKILSIKIHCQRDKRHDQMYPERLFEPFWTTSESGMGLGLFLARELLKKMNGEVLFEQDDKRFGFLVKLRVKDAQRVK